MSERASDAIAEQLRRMIITTELAPGTLVSEAHLSELLGCGRTPLREALQQLRHQYLVVTPPRRGILIPQLSIVDFQQAHEAMLFMGSAYIELAVERISDEQLQEIKEIVAQQRHANKAVDSYALAELDFRFHTLIAQITRNRYFADSARRLHSALARFICPAYQAAGDASLSIAEHEQIVEALARRDAQLAKQRFSEHTTKGRQRILNILGLGNQPIPL